MGINSQEFASVFLYNSDYFMKTHSYTLFSYDFVLFMISDLRVFL